MTRFAFGAKCGGLGAIGSAAEAGADRSCDSIRSGASAILPTPTPQARKKWRRVVARSRAAARRGSGGVMRWASKDGGDVVPVVRQLGVVRGLLGRQGALGPDGEVDPAAAMRASADESRVVPPGADQGIMHGPAVVIQTEVDRLQ